MALSTAAWTIGEWTGSAVVGELISTGFSYFRDHMLPADSKAELNRLHAALPKITAVMGIAEELKKKHPAAGQWVEQFRQALEASEDVLDELEYKKLEGMVKNRDEAGGSASSSKKRKTCTINDDTLERLKEAVTLLDQAANDVELLLQAANVLGIRDLSESQQETRKVVCRETTSFLKERELFGREVEKDKIIDWLKRPIDARLSSFGIVGVGGQGKTTLVQFAYKEMRGSNHFDISIWVCVSTNFNVEEITKKMLGELGESCYGYKPLNALQETLKEKIHLKKILLVLDDVWDDEKRSDWELLIAPLRSVREGSKILFTTRMNSVAYLLASVIGREYESLTLQGLGVEELRLLFCSYAFQGYDDPDNHGDLQAIGDQILKTLYGSPLAAKVIGTLLNSYMDPEYWRRILDQGCMFNLEQAKDILDILKLSYYHLTADVQVCFRFCSIFPQDHLFDKNDLIKMWIVSGFIQQQSSQGKRPEDIGEDYFNILLRKSFFEYSNCGEDFNQMRITSVFIPQQSSQEERRYIMHDLIHELAQNVSNGECCRIEFNDKFINIPSTARHVSIHESEIKRVPHLENLRTLVITTSTNEDGTDLDSFVLPDNLVKKSLRLLKISGPKCCEMPKEISCLVHLRYISIEHYHVTQSFNNLLFASVCKLYHLQVLEFRKALYNSANRRIKTTGMTNLLRLRYMRLPVDTIQTICGIHKLTSLQELTFFIGKEHGYRINELGTLNNLKHLSINKMENIGDPAEAKRANLLEMNKLMSLSLKWTSESNPNNPEQIMDCLEPHPNLIELTIENYKGQRSPSWMEESPLLNLKSLKLFSCPFWKNQLISWQMPYLKILNIYNCVNLDKLPDMPLSLIEFHIHSVGLTSLPNLYRSSGNRTLQSLSLKSLLRVVMIKSCPNLISLNGFLQQDNLDLQALKKITIIDCEKLVLVPVDAFGKLASLQHLSIGDCQNLTELPSLPLTLTEFCIDNVGVSALPNYQNSDSRGSPSASPLNSSLKEVKIINCPKLTALNGFMQQGNIDFQSIKELTINYCPMLVPNDSQNNLLPMAFGSLNQLVEHSSREQAHGSNQGSSWASLKLSHLEIDHLSLLLIEPLRRLRFVCSLSVDDCSGMENLPEQWLLQNSNTLGSLTILDASSLISLPATMARLTALEDLQIFNADLLVELPELPASLKEKYIDGRQL